jgi:hypothetical protein
MEPLRIAADHFTSIGMTLTDKACRALATAIGLAGSINDCDESFVSIGLRRSNSILAHLTDRFHLDFAKSDDEVAEHADAKDEEIIRHELTRGILLDDSTLLCDEFLLYDDLPVSPGYEPPARKVEHLGIEGEPDETTLDSIRDNEPDILVRAAKAAKDDHRNRIETLDFVAPIADLPNTCGVFQRARVSQSRLHQELSRFKTLEPFAEQQQYVLIFDEGHLRLKTFGLLDGVKYEERDVLPQNLVVQLSTTAPFVSQRAIEEFEELINWQNVSERDIHRFLIQHPYFLQGDDYCALHSELVLDRGDKGSLIPDFFAELVHRNYVDIIDLKKPNEQLIVGSVNRRGFSAAVNSAVYQLREYRDFFESSKKRNEFHARYGLRAWYPKIAVVIGRTPHGAEYEDLVRARRSVFDATIVTYDDLLARARRRCVVVGCERRDV